MQWQYQINWDAVMKFILRTLGVVAKFFWRFLAFLFGLLLVFFAYGLLMEGKFSGVEFISVIVISIFLFLWWCLSLIFRSFRLGGQF